MSAAIEMSGVSRTFGDGPTQVQALRGISLSIDYGEFVAVMGRPVRASPRCWV